MSKTRIPPITDEDEARIQAQIASDPDAPELTDEQLAQGRPFAQMFAQLAASIGRGRPRLQDPKQVVSLRLDPDVLAAWRGSGPGWQSRMNDALRKAMPSR